MALLASDVMLLMHLLCTSSGPTFLEERLSIVLFLVDMHRGGVSLRVGIFSVGQAVIILLVAVSDVHLHHVSLQLIHVVEDVVCFIACLEPLLFLFGVVVHLFLCSVHSSVAEDMLLFLEMYLL